MPEVRDGSVQAVVCSPPYWRLKDYGHPEQIGHGESYDEYLDRLDRVWQECYRTLRDDGTLWIVIDKVWLNGRMVHIPHDVAKRCKRLGFVLKDLIVWYKPSALAGMSPRSSVNKHEIIILLAKQRKQPKMLTNGESDFWRVAVKAGSIRATPDHKAPFPEELVRRMISAATKPGDVVLDPFLGSGTTARVALEMRRRFIGYEINEEFRAMIDRRLKLGPLPGPGFHG